MSGQQPTLKIKLSPQALSDLLGISDYIATDSIAASERFLQAVEDAFALLGQMPGVGRAYTVSSRGITLRRWTIPGFENYLIFYHPGECVEVVRVLHGARDIERILT